MATIHVTQSDIQAGVPADGRCCMMALAMSRTTQRPVYVSYGLPPEVKVCAVGPFWKYEDGPGAGVIRAMPDTCLPLMRDFDGGRPVQPFSFEVEL